MLEMLEQPERAAEWWSDLSAFTGGADVFVQVKHNLSMVYEMFALARQSWTCGLEQWFCYEE
jgi:hypothetical protein